MLGKPNKYIRFSLTYGITLLFFSCGKDKEAVYTVCDCRGTKIENVVLEGGVVALSRDGYKIISVEHGYVTTCSDLPTEFQVDGQLVLFSGRIIPTCKKFHSGTGLWSLYMETTEIRKIDTLYQKGPLTINTIRTEDYGKQKGFGYIVNDTRKDFKIVQDEIPAQLGTDPFKTREEALKIAYVVAFRLENTKNFPSIYLGDLYFLKIIKIN